MRGLAVLLALCTGCSHTQVHLSANNGTSGSSTQSSVQVRSHSGSDLVTLLGLTIVAATIIEMERGRLGDSRAIPEMAADRTVSERDCTQPIEEFSGNLRCK
jgi:hypothetical protein